MQPYQCQTGVQVTHRLFTGELGTAHRVPSCTPPARGKAAKLNICLCKYFIYIRANERGQRLSGSYPVRPMYQFFCILETIGSLKLSIYSL